MGDVEILNRQQIEEQNKNLITYNNEIRELRKLYKTYLKDNKW